MIMLLYLNGTVFLFAYGPWRFPMDDTSQLYVFLALSHCALLGGYLSGIVRQPKRARYKIRPGTFVTIGAAATLFMLFPTSAARTGHAIPDIIAGINDPGVAYDQSQYIRNLHPSAVEYIRIFLAPLFSLSLPFTIFGWQTLTKSRKILGVSAILATVALYVSMGTNKAIADCALLTPWMLAAGHFSGVSRLNRTKVLLSLGLTAAGILGFITFFSNTFATRSESGAAAGYFTAIRTYADPDNFLVRDLSPAGKVTVYGLSG
ncbi:MAG: hypothetical protein LAP21_16020, partial [Acidobacteriia bacterium]|nr:hypothetical protein [Terriglobia bacterium]